MPVTLKDIAEKAQVSIRTASRALNASGPVKAEIAERILAIARECNYTPNMAARNLRKQSTNIIGLVYSGNLSEAGQRLQMLIEEELSTQKYNILLASLPPEQTDLEALLSNWRGIAEAVIFTAWNPSFRVNELKKFNMKTVFIDCDVRSHDFHQVRIDRASGVKDAVLAMIHSGCRRIAHVSDLFSEGRGQGFRQAIESAGRPVEYITIQSPNLTMDSGYCAGEKVLANKADAVFFDTDRMALGFYRFCYERHVKIPAEIAVAGFDNDSAGAFANPSLSSVGHPYKTMVKKAIELLNENTAGVFVYPTEFIARESITQK